MANLDGGDGGFSVAGVRPRLVFEPASTAECVHVFGQCRDERLSVAAVGGGTELGLGSQPRRLDAVVSTRRLDRVVDYAPADMVLEVEAGATLAAVQRVAGAQRQRLAYDAPQAERATIGGLLATANFGPLRTRFGALRDLVLGASVIGADGVVFRGGGKVVKNVAGFDLPKLMAGALGTLGTIATVTLRLHPLPETSATMIARGIGADRVRALVERVRREQMEPAAVVAMGGPRLYDVLLRFEGFARAVEVLTESASRRLEERLDLLSGDEAGAAWAEHDARRAAGDGQVKVSAPPSAFGRVAAGAVSALCDALAGARVVAYPTIGVFFVCGGVADAGAFAGAVALARSSLSSGAGWVVVHDQPRGSRSSVDAWGPPPPALPLMRRLKARFDPEGRLNPGRFVGGI